MSFIVCEGLVKVHKVANLEVLALQGLDLACERGEILGVIGSSGSGKSTLLNVLGGLDRATAGKCIVNGKDLLKLGEADLNTYRRKDVGFVWQQGARNIVHYIDALNNVMLPMHLDGVVGGAARSRALQLLESVGLRDRARHRIAALSGGEQQRLSIAVALANRPPLLLADEPTGELDGANAQRIYQVFRDLRQSLGITIIIVSHERQIAQQVDRVIGIQDGKVATETDAALKGESRLMLDSAGRLQIPKALREQYGIGTRVTIEPSPDGLVIKPVADERSGGAA